VSKAFVRCSSAPTVFRTQTESRKRAVDITRDLLTIWNVCELDKWAKERRSTGECEKVNALQVATEPGTTSNSLPTDALAECFEEEAQRAKRVADSAEKNAAFVRSLKPGRNGKHHPT